MNVFTVGLKLTRFYQGTAEEGGKEASMALAESPTSPQIRLTPKRETALQQIPDVETEKLEDLAKIASTYAYKIK